MSYYEAHIELGDHEWDIVRENGPAQVDDDLRVCDGLSFGWSMPAGLWPFQPDAMTASLRLNVPDFDDVADLVEGDPVAIQVKVHPTEDPVFEFFGRITDLDAIARGKRRSGVTLSVIAVEYNVDLATLPPWRPASPPVGYAYSNSAFLPLLWADRGLGTFPAWPTLLGFPGVGIFFPDEARDVDAVIFEQLRQAIGFSDWAVTGTTGPSAIPDRRMILAAHIDPATLRPHATQPWALDVVDKAAVGSPIEIPGHKIRRDSIRWVYAKGNGPTRVEAIGFNNDSNNIVAAEHAGVTKHRTERIDVTVNATNRAQNVADFYLPPIDPSGWRVDTFTYLVSRHTLAELETFPADLFPRLTVTDTNADLTRAACYGRGIRLTDLPADLVPLAGTDVDGRLTGATVNISARHLTLDLQLRQTTT